MIKICHITTKHRAFDTRIFYKECNALKSVYSVVLLASNARNEVVNDIKIVGFKYVEGLMVGNYWNIFYAAYRQKATLYHIHDPELLPVARFLKLLGKEIIYDIHENYAETLKEHHYPWLVRNFFYFFENWATRNCALILAERSYIRIYQERAANFCVVENFCDVKALQSYVVADRTNCRKMIYIGTLHSHRGALVMIEVLHLLRERGLDISLDLVGKITEAGLMKKLNSLPFYDSLKEHITWYGPLSLSESYMVAQQSFAGLCMLEGFPNHTESYPTKIFEYMAVGLPVVASNFSLYRSVVERRECGICVPFDDVNALADALEQIYTDKILRLKYAANGPVNVAQNYNWNSEKNILLDFYHKILRKKN